MLDISRHQLKEQIWGRAYTLIYLQAVALTSILLVACQPVEAPFECTDEIGCVTIKPNEPLKIGVIQDFSGGAATFGLEQVNSIKLAVSKRDNQFLGHPIELQIEDEKCTVEGGANAALRIIADPQVVGIIGTTCSNSAATASELMSEAGLVMISGTNGAPSLTAVGGEPGSDWHPGYFRTMWNGSEHGRAAAVFTFQELGVTTAATINDGDIFTRQLTDVFGQALTEMGGKIVLSATINKGDRDMHPVLTAVATAEPELLFFPIFPPEGDFIVQQAKEVAGLENIILMGNGALIAETFIEAVKADGLGMYFVGPAPLQGATSDKLASEYQLQYGQLPPSANYGYTYDATNLLLKAIEAVAVQEQNGILHVGRQALREALYATTSLEGVTGTLTCDKFGDCSSIRANVVRLDDPVAGLEGLRSNVVYTYTSER